MLTVGGQNLVDLTAVTDDYYYDPSGVYTAISNARLTDYIPVTAGQKYTVYAKAARSGTAANVRCNLFDAAKAWKSQSSFTVTSGSENVGVVTPSENGYLRVSANYTGTGAKVDWSTLQVVVGEYTVSTMPEYEPYYNGGSATAEMLLKAGDYQDTQEVIAGNVTRNIGIKIFDGTETFTVSSSGAMITAISDVKIGAENAPINTHFALETSPTSIASGTQRFGASGTKIYSANYYMKPLTTMTASDFKQFLADQYNAGTPVILVYPLATATTESVTAQTLTAQEGTNVINSNKGAREMEVKYYRT